MIIKLIVKQSEKISLRAEQDWIDCHNLQTAIKDDTVLNRMLSAEKTTESKMLQKTSNDILLEERILLSGEDVLKIKF